MPTPETTDLVARIRARPNDAPLPAERLLDEAAEEIERLRQVVNAARAFSRCAAEFHGDLQYCEEHIDRLWVAIDRLEQEESANAGP